MRVLGDGPGVTIIQFTSAAADAAGMTFSPGDFTRPVTIQDMSLLTMVDQTAGNAAITIRYGAANSNIFKGPRITNVEIASPGNNTAYWGVGIDGYNIWGFDIHGVHVRGKDIGGVTAFPTAGTEAAIRVTGQFGGGCSDGKVSGVNGIFVRYVGRVIGDCEGIHWTDNTGVAVDVGISYEGAPGAPGFYIARNHFNAFRIGILNTGFVQGFVTNNLLYKWDNSKQPWIGVAMAQANEFVGSGNGNIISHNTFAGGVKAADGGNIVGVTAINTDGNIIDSNIFIAMDYIVDLGGSTTSNIVKDNSSVGTRFGWQKNIGLNTVSSGNLPVNAGNDAPAITFNLGATTFNVGAWFQKIFFTNNNSATTMTDFTNAETGRQITIIAADAFTTIKNNSRIRLKGNTDMAMAAGASLTLINAGQFWQEIGRSQ